MRDTDSRLPSRGHLKVIRGGKQDPLELLAELRANPAALPEAAFTARLAEAARFLTMFERVRLIKRRREMLAREAAADGQKNAPA